MDYRFDCLNPKDFENLVQALCKKIIGEGVKVFGAGPDGQREATFNGKANYPSTVEQWDGYWVIQAKYKGTQTKTDDYVWIRDCRCFYFSNNIAVDPTSMSFYICRAKRRKFSSSLGATAILLP